MEYHEIGERFDYNRVILEVERANVNGCNGCYFHKRRPCEETMYCAFVDRKDNTDVIFKLVGQFKTYPKIGDVIGYGAVNLNVVEWTEDNGCSDCYFHDNNCPDWCNEETKFILIEQCKTKDMEQKNEEPQSKNNSIKNDHLDDKLRWELLPLEDVEDIVRVYTAGAKKYGENKWQDLPDGIRRYKAALLRHLVEFDKGNEIDKETGCLHLAQCAWNAIAMLHISKQQKKNGNQN